MKKIIWIDFENAPHVWVFKEIINKLRNENKEVLITARDFSSTINLCNYFGFHPISKEKKYFTKSTIGKIYHTIKRGLYLAKLIKSNNTLPNLALSHGSRSQAFAAKLLGLKVISLDDFENSFQGFNYFVDYLLTPFPIEKNKWGKHSKKVQHYPGLKEELYLWNEDNFNCNDFNFLNDSHINVLFRPEGRYTHYSSEKSLLVQNKLLDIFSITPGIKIILIARDKEQENNLIREFSKRKIDYIIPEKILNGPALINNCDLLIGGGGTMNREAAVLGVPAYSFFGGKLGDVDRYLIKNNKLVMIENEDDISKIKFVKKSKNYQTKISKDAFNYVYSFILDELESGGKQ